MESEMWAQRVQVSYFGDLVLGCIFCFSISIARQLCCLACHVMTCNGGQQEPQVSPEFKSLNKTYESITFCDILTR